MLSKTEIKYIFWLEAGFSKLEGKPLILGHNRARNQGREIQLNLNKITDSKVPESIQTSKLKILSKSPDKFTFGPRHKKPIKPLF